MGIVAHPVIQRLDRALQPFGPRVKLHQKPGPARKAAGEIFHPVKVCTDTGTGPRKGRTQAFCKRHLTPAKKCRPVQTQRIGQPLQHLRRDLAATMFDKVEV